ncbi:MAG: L,D-transpeptidase [Saprospiraceae bacterium]|nr:L,D-transpeptidase [Saprospiraceae bacterium]
MQRFTPTNSTDVGTVTDTMSPKSIKIPLFLVFLTIFLPARAQSESWSIVPGDGLNQQRVVIEENIIIGQYFDLMADLVDTLNAQTGRKITEHILVHANYWIVDSLVETDYYQRMEKGIFTFDQRELIILKKNDTLLVPHWQEITVLQAKLDATALDINIPEFKLRILENGNVLRSMPVRVGRNTRRYLEAVKRMEDLRTKTGEGRIVRIEKNPIFFDPVNAKKYELTRRDDGKRTRTPRIPWLEPEINGQRHGQLIHPTTNPKTLGKAYSNGCVGVGEGDAWRIYYHAPIGTRVIIRYDLETDNTRGEKNGLFDIYGKKASIE